MKQRSTLGQFVNKGSVAGLICTLPFIIGFFVFMFIPMLMSLYYSFCNYDILTAPKWAGFSNFTKMFSDPTFFQTIGVTLYYTVVSVPIRLIFALLVSMLLLRSTRLTGLYRGLFYLPSIIGGSVAVSVLWKQMFSAEGVINQIFSLLGLPGDTAWLGDTRTAIWSLIVLAVWQFGSPMLIFLASLKQIPVSLYEASGIDGANKVQKFFRITLPLLTPTIFFNLVMQTINGFLAFTQCYIITQGKPLNSTLFYAVYMYQQSFQFRNTGYGAALAWVMLIVVGTFTAILFGTKKYWVYSEGGK